jgi:hypothetical protein
MNIDIAVIPEAIAEMDRLGDEIAELSAHLDAAGAHLLDLIREFDARGGWNHGFRSCADLAGRRCGERCIIATVAAGSRAAICRSAKGITFATGPRAGRPRSRTSRCSAGVTIGPPTRRDITSNVSRTASCGSGDRMDGHCPMSRLRPRCPAIRSKRCERGMKRLGFR